MSDPERNRSHDSGRHQSPSDGRGRRGSILSALYPGHGSHGEGERRESIFSVMTDLLPEPSSFVSTAPIVQQILGRDIAECSSSDDEDDGLYGARSGRSEAAASPRRASDAFSTTSSQRHAAAVAASEAPLAFHPNGVAFGCGFSGVPIQGVGRPVPNEHDIHESIEAELELLRDNNLMPPSASDSVVRRRRSTIYRRIFSTNVRDHEPKHVERGEAASETSPLLHRASVDGVGEAGPSSPSSSATSSLTLAEPAPTPPDDVVHDRFSEAVAAHAIRTTWQREARTLVSYALPLIATFLLHYSVTIASVLTVGRLGMVELAAVNLATMTASITCYVPVQGLATCLDTLCAQAYGSGHKHLVGLQAQRMTFFLWILMVPVAVLWWFSYPILAALVPGEETSRLAALYLRVLILGMPGVAAFESGKRFVQAQGLFHATTYTLLVGAPLSFLQNYLFVFRFGWHFAGAAAAMAVTQNLLPLLLVLYVRFFEGRECWRGFSWKAFSNWGPMVRLALPGMIMIEAQFSVLEILTIAAGQFGTAQLAAQSVLVTVTSTSFNVPFPLAIATSTRVANLIGAHLGEAAQKTARVAVVAGLVVGSFNMALFVALRSRLPRVFTGDDEVVEIVSRVILVCAAMQVFDALAAVSHGILRGLGRQAVGGYANLFSYYCVALPVSLSTAFALGWKLSGLWAGLTAGLAVVSALELLYIYNSDWESAVRQAEERMRSEDATMGETKHHATTLQ